MSVLTIYPYVLDGFCWVFDDERTGLKEEAFVLGMSEMISRVIETKGMVGAERGFTLSFSDEPFEDVDVELSWVQADHSQAFRQDDGTTSQVSGNWYRGLVAGQEMEGWLCPALGLYFSTPPKKIYVKAAPLPAGVDPIWHIDRNAERARRFVSAPG